MTEIYSDTFKVGKHEWRAIYDSDKNTWTAEFYQNFGPCGYWTSHRRWPRYNLNNGSTLGLPKTVCRRCSEFWQTFQAVDA